MDCTAYIGYKKDVETSMDLARQFQKFIKPKECYLNTWKVTCDGHALRDHPNWRVAYGYLPLHIEPLLCNHAFFLDMERGVVIDPTVPSRKDDSDQRPYFIAVSFTVDEYMRVVTKQKGEIDSFRNKIIRAPMTKLAQWLASQGMICCG